MSDCDRILEAIDSLATTEMPLVAVRRIQAVLCWAPRRLRESLLAAARVERIELQGGGGVGLLTEEERTYCPRMSDGRTYLVYARRI